MSNRSYELRDSNRVGRSLFATKSIPFGTLILSDSDVLLKFSAEDTTPLSQLLQFWDNDFDGVITNNVPRDDVQQQPLAVAGVEAKHFIAKYNSLPALTLSAVAVINQTCEKLISATKNTNNAHDKNRLSQIWQHIKNMHSPALPISPDTFLMYQSCEKLLELKQREIDYNNLEFDLSKEISTLWNSTTTTTNNNNNNNNEDNNHAAVVTAASSATVASCVMHAVMALKTNAHRATDNDWCLFPMASKFAHSCDPNCYFIPPSAANNFTASFIAMKKSIEKGDVLSFSYLGGPALTLSTNQRRRRLQRSHLFVCRCVRCEETEDNAAAAVVLAGNKEESRSIYVRLSCPLGFCEADLESSSSRKGMWRRVGGNGVLSSSSSSPPPALFLTDNQVCASYDDKYNPHLVFRQDDSKAIKVKYSSIVAAIKSLTTIIVNNTTTTNKKNSDDEAQHEQQQQQQQLPPHLNFSTTVPNIAKALLHRKYFLAQPLICEACRHAVSYFTTMCQISIRAANSGLVPKKKPKITPFQLLFCWTMKYFSCLEAMRILNREEITRKSNNSNNGEFDLPTSDFAQGSLGRLSDPPHMLVAQTAVTLIDLCLQHPPNNNAAKSNETTNDAGEVILVPDAIPATGILAVLAHHCRSFVAATVLKNTSSGNTTYRQDQEKKLTKIDVLCELETDTFVAIKDCPLMMCLEMSCADEMWKWMAFGNESGLCKKKGVFDANNEFKQLFEGWDA